MARYVDGFVIPIKRNKLKEYTRIAKWGCKIWMKHGALSYYECAMDDFPNHGMGFKKLCKLKTGETAVFAFVVYRSKAHRDQVNKRVMKEMDKSGQEFSVMPFDMKRFSMAGCKVLVHKD